MMDVLSSVLYLLRTSNLLFIEMSASPLPILERYNQHIPSSSIVGLVPDSTSEPRLIDVPEDADSDFDVMINV